MPKKSKSAKASQFFIDAEPASIKSIQSITREEKLQSELGDYITAKEVHKRTGISSNTLRTWYKKGKIRGTKSGSTWLYSLQDIVVEIRRS